MENTRMRGAFVFQMAMSNATHARREALHTLVSETICAGLYPVAGVDEVGAGALAGPVIAAAVLLLPPAKQLSIPGLDDSKRLTRLQRERLYDSLMTINSCNIETKVNDHQQHDVPLVEISTGMVSAKEVDQINVLQARLKAMSLAVRGLSSCVPRVVFVDGNRTIDLEGLHLNNGEGEIEQRTVVGGDARVSVIAAASIVAKVHRDRLMLEHASQFPEYGFERHVGYPTRKHLEALHEHGPCEIHRMTFKPVAMSQTRMGGKYT